MQKFNRITITLTLMLAIFLGGFVLADEGMWTLDNLPVKQLQQKYQFTPTPEWVRHIQLSAVRISDGGSASFISPSGLVLTNHHVAVTQLHKMSSEQKDYIKDGFYARTPAEEIKCPDVEFNVLVDMVDVTPQIENAMKGRIEKEAITARNAEIARIEKENNEKTGFKSQVVTLYLGGEYWLYTYKKYRDVRLVFAPEKAVAFYGGDYDNFTYPRYDLDFAIFRAYENDKPAVVKNYLKVNPNGLKEDELVFVAGHPGSTDRLVTYAQLLFMRDFEYPHRLNTYKRKIKMLEKYGTRSPEHKRQTNSDLYDFLNSQKASRGEYEGLLSKKLIKDYADREARLRAAVNKNPALKKEIGDPWADIEKALVNYKQNYKKFMYRYMDGDLPGKAAVLVFYATESQKPDAQRLSAYHESQLDTIRYELTSPAPMYKELDEVKLADSMREAVENLGPDDPYVKILLDGKTPEARAKELIEGTNLQDVEFRKQLVKGGPAAILNSKDPLIQLAVKLAPMRREIKSWLENEYQGTVRSAYQRIARARFKVYGKNTYPDATFTLRLAYGTMKGYPYNGTIAPYKTTFYGMYDRYYSFDQKHNDAWRLPQKYVDVKNRMNLETPLNFVSTCDIIGGNSGSPTINRNGEIVGLIFDGNMESLPGNFFFDEEINRAVSVNMGAIMEVLSKVYEADALVKEMMP